MTETEGNLTAATATPLVLTASGFVKVSANLYPNGDTDFYSFTAHAGDRIYTAVMTSGSAGTSTDSQLTLLASDGTTVIEFDDDNGSFAGLSSSIAGAVIPSDGTYFLKVNDFTAGTTSERGYDLYVQVRSGTPTAETEPNDTPATANSGTFWASGARDVAAATEQDYYAVTLQAGDTVFLSLDLNPERDATTWNGRLGFGQFGDATNQLAAVDDAGTGDVSPNPILPSEAFFMTVKDAGTYYVMVDSASAGVGGATATYGLSISVLPRIAGTYTTYTSTDVPQTIGPGTGLTTSTITIPGNPRIEDIDVEIQLNHALMQDIDAHLVSPAGNDNGLFTDIGAAAIGGQTQMDLVFDDEAAIPPAFTVLKGLQVKPENNSTAGTASTSGAFRLAPFYGENGGGNWTLKLWDDTAGANGGTLTGWSIRIREREPMGTVAGYLPQVVFTTDFESGDAGFTHTGTQDEWELGWPATAATATTNPVADFSTAHSGVACWKTDLDGTYNASSNQDLVSPDIDLANYPGPVVVTWAMRHQIETANFDHMYVDIEEVDGPAKVRLYEWLNPTPISASAGTGNPQQNIGGSYGWGLHSVRADSMAGKKVRVRFHLDSDTTVQFGGLAVDDVSVTGYKLSPPDTTITTTPPAVSNSTTAEITFTASGGGTLDRFEGQLDGGGYATVANPATFIGLAEGSHTFQVRAVDTLGSVDDTPASYTWTVDATAPDTSLTSTPSVLSNSSSASFSFSGADGGGSGVAKFEGSLDGGPFTTCASPQFLMGLSDGLHTFQVRSVDNAGNVDPTPAFHSWTIDTTPPAAPMVSTPPNGMSAYNRRPPFAGTAEPNSTVTVYLDGSSLATTTADASGNWSYTISADLSGGSHTVRATATDAAGNTSPDSNTNTFEVLVGTPTPTVGTLSLPPGQNGYVVSRQTGLFSMSVPVTNTTATAINGFRLTVDFSAYVAAYPSLRLYNASSAPGVTPAYIDYPYPVAQGAVVNVELNFYTSTRTFPNPFNPVLTASNLPVSDVAGAEGPGVAATIRLAAPGQILLEWPSVVGHWYRVQYSDDMSPNSWFYSPVPLQAAGSRMQWIDTGAPFTSAPPGAARFYRVNEIPAPALPPPP